MILAALQSAASLSDSAELKIGEMNLGTLALALLASVASALVLSWAYSFCFGPRATGSQVHRAFPLISLAVTAIFICVQFSLPLSLGLLGSLSVVRFRTPIKEPEEIGFIMLVIAAALCCAAYRMGFLLLLLGSTLMVLLLLRWSPRFLGRRAGTGPGPRGRGRRTPAAEADGARRCRPVLGPQAVSTRTGSPRDHASTSSTAWP